MKKAESVSWGKLDIPREVEQEEKKDLEKPVEDNQEQVSAKFRC